MTLELELKQRDVRILMLDAGDEEGYKPSRWSVATSAGTRYPPLRFVRREGFGGTRPTGDEAPPPHDALLSGGSGGRGLLGFGPSQLQTWRNAAKYVDKILEGARPGDIPVEQPARYEFVINLKTAKVLRRTIPPSVLARADEVIQ